VTAAVKKIPLTVIEGIFWALIILFYIASMLLGIESPVGLAKYIPQFVLLCVGLWWFYQDSLKYEKITEQSRRNYMLASMFLFPAPMLFYVYATRTFKEGSVVLLKFFLKLVLLGVALAGISTFIDMYIKHVT
jgi:hypothetical protein